MLHLFPSSAPARAETGQTQVSNLELRSGPLVCEAGIQLLEQSPVACQDAH